jgi:prolipoprotein diacylglyceryltransferase
VFGAFAFDACFLALLFRRFPGQSLGALLDASASVTAFNLAVGRLGCLLGGCCYGAPAAPSPFTLPVRAFDPASPAGVAYLATPERRDVCPDAQRRRL